MNFRAHNLYIFRQIQVKFVMRVVDLMLSNKDVIVESCCREGPFFAQRRKLNFDGVLCIFHKILLKIRYGNFPEKPY